MADFSSLEERLRSLMSGSNTGYDKEETALIVFTSPSYGNYSYPKVYGVYSFFNDLTKIKLTETHERVYSAFFYNDQLYHLTGRRMYNTFDKRELVLEFQNNLRNPCVYNDGAYSLLDSKIIDIFSSRIISKNQNLNECNDLFVWDNRLCYSVRNVVYDAFSSEEILLLEKDKTLKTSVRLLSDNTGNFVLFGHYDFGNDPYYHHNVLHRVLSNLPNPLKISSTEEIASYEKFEILHQSAKALFYIYYDCGENKKIYSMYNSDFKIIVGGYLPYKSDSYGEHISALVPVPKKFIDSIKKI